MNQIAKVKYQIGTYEGIISVNCDENDTNDAIEFQAKRQLNRNPGGLPYPAYRSFRVIERIEDTHCE